MRRKERLQGLMDVIESEEKPQRPSILDVEEVEDESEEDRWREEELKVEELVRSLFEGLH